MSSTTATTDLATLLLRATLGSVMLAHGLLKFIVFTLPGTAGYFESIGFPGWAAYVVAPAEVLGGIALLVGVQSRWVALASLPLLAGALLAHAGNGWLFSNKNGGWEFPLVLVVLAVIVALLGDGRYTLRALVRSPAPRLARVCALRKPRVRPSLGLARGRPRAGRAAPVRRPGPLAAAAGFRP